MAFKRQFCLAGNYRSEVKSGSVTSVVKFYANEL